MNVCQSFSLSYLIPNNITVEIFLFLSHPSHFLRTGLLFLLPYFIVLFPLLKATYTFFHMDDAMVTLPKCDNPKHNKHTFETLKWKFRWFSFYLCSYVEIRWNIRYTTTYVAKTWSIEANRWVVGGIQSKMNMNWNRQLMPLHPNKVPVHIMGFILFRKER